MVKYKRKGRGGIEATQFTVPTITLAEGVSASFQHQSKGQVSRIKDGWWVIPNEDPDLPDKVLSDEEFTELYEVDNE